MSNSKISGPTVLCILDGWAQREARENNAIALADTPNWDRLIQTYPNNLLDCSGQDVGLEFLEFTPKSEVRKEFYAEIPVSIKVNGGFHDLAIFFDKVARLSRIVNIKNIDMGPGKDSQELNTSCTAVTYKFVEPAPKKPSKKKKKKKKKRKRK